VAFCNHEFADFSISPIHPEVSPEMNGRLSHPL
jgi:hypothetical protein